MEINCFSCNTSVPHNSNYCFSCGSKLKCANCSTDIIKNAKFCTGCGESFNKENLSTQQNTIKYKKNKEETSYEIALSDNIIGQDGLKDFLSAIVGNRINETKSLDNASYIELKELASNLETEKNNHSSDTEEDVKEEIIPNTTSENDYPHINDIGRDREYSESEWVVLSAFYLSKFGKEDFTLKDVKAQYLTLRHTSSRQNKFGREWDKLFPKFLQTISTDVYRLKASGIDDIKQLILADATKITKSAKTKSKSPGVVKTPAKGISPIEFDIFKDANKKSLEEFFKEKNPETTPDKLLVLAFYISKINNQGYFNEGNIEYAFKILQLKDRPNHLRQTINNAKNSKLWFKDHESGGWTVERHAETHIDKMPIPKESK